MFEAVIDFLRFAGEEIRSQLRFIFLARKTKPYLRELEELLIVLEEGHLDCASAHEKFEELATVFSVSTWHQGLQQKDQDQRLFRGEDAKIACGIYNLLGELLQLTSFDNRDRHAFHCARMIVKDHIRDYCLNSYWGELVRRRGPIEGLMHYKCGICGSDWLEAAVNGFLMSIAVFCESCGAMLMLSVACEEQEQVYRLYTIEDERERYEAARALQVAVPRCECGGKFLRRIPPIAYDSHQNHHRCRFCGMGTVEVSYPSPYEYFQHHRWYHSPEELLRRPESDSNAAV